MSSKSCVSDSESSLRIWATVAGYLVSLGIGKIKVLDVVAKGKVFMLSSLLSFHTTLFMLSEP